MSNTYQKRKASKEYAIDSSGHINVSAEDEFTSTEIKYPSRSI